MGIAPRMHRPAAEPGRRLDPKPLERRTAGSWTFAETQAAAPTSLRRIKGRRSDDAGTAEKTLKPRSIFRRSRAAGGCGRRSEALAGIIPVACERCSRQGVAFSRSSAEGADSATDLHSAQAVDDPRKRKPAPLLYLTVARRRSQSFPPPSPRFPPVRPPRPSSARRNASRSRKIRPDRNAFGLRPRGPPNEKACREGGSAGFRTFDDFRTRTGWKKGVPNGGGEMVPRVGSTRTAGVFAFRFSVSWFRLRGSSEERNGSGRCWGRFAGGDFIDAMAGKAAGARPRGERPGAEPSTRLATGRVFWTPSATRGRIERRLPIRGASESPL